MIEFIKQLTLEQFNKEMSKQFDLAREAEKLMHEQAKIDLLFYGYTPPTRWQKFKYRLADLKQRAKDIWTILRGGDIHDGCC